jgi:hypothetical protein
MKPDSSRVVRKHQSPSTLHLKLFLDEKKWYALDSTSAATSPKPLEGKQDAKFDCAGFCHLVNSKSGESVCFYSLHQFSLLYEGDVLTGPAWEESQYLRTPSGEKIDMLSPDVSVTVKRGVFAN